MEPDKEKRLLRSLVRERTALFSKEYKEKASLEIFRKVITSEEFKRSKAVFSYISLENEPDTSLFIKKALEEKKAVFVPLVRDKKMEAVRIYDYSDPFLGFRTGAFGIKEPFLTENTEFLKEGEYSKEEILGIIPCMAADRKGRRLGHGGGYYDRFLSRNRMKTVCLLFSRNLEEKIPSGEYDILMDSVITEL